MFVFLIWKTNLQDLIDCSKNDQCSGREPGTELRSGIVDNDLSGFHSGRCRSDGKMMTNVLSANVLCWDFLSFDFRALVQDDVTTESTEARGQVSSSPLLTSALLCLLRNWFNL